VQTLIINAKENPESNLDLGLRTLLEVDNHFETKISNLYVGGDGAGITRGLAQAGANGVKIARSIIEKELTK
jgi:uncharacterized FAD-dependent dehydrogenase